MPGLEPPPTPSQDSRVHTQLFVAAKSALGEKIGEFSGRRLGSWLGDLGQLLKSQAQPVLLEVRSRFTQWLIPQLTYT